MWQIRRATDIVVFHRVLWALLIELSRELSSTGHKHDGEHSLLHIIKSFLIPRWLWSPIVMGRSRLLCDSLTTLRHGGGEEWRCYLVLPHAVTWVEDDPFTHHYGFIRRVVVKAVVGLSSILQLLDEIRLANVC